MASVELAKTKLAKDGHEEDDSASTVSGDLSEDEADVSNHPWRKTAPVRKPYSRGSASTLDEVCEDRQAIQELDRSSIGTSTRLPLGRGTAQNLGGGTSVAEQGALLRSR